MTWLRSHPYIAALLIAGVFILSGLVIVLNRVAAPVEGQPTRAWGGVGGYLLDPAAPVGNLGTQPQENIYAQVQSGPPFHYSPASILNTSADGEEEFDFETFLSTLSTPAASGAIAEESSMDAYSFIPTGLISAESAEMRRTQLEQSLYTYGNEAGSIIQSFESSYPNAPQILKDQFEDREDSTKNERLLSLARGLGRVGVEIGRVEPVPATIVQAHEKVVGSYKELGQKLEIVQKARTDEAVLEGILSYNTAVEAYVRNYVTLATLFSAHGVKFSLDDPGSVFTFTNVSL